MKRTTPFDELPEDSRPEEQRPEVQRTVAHRPVTIVGTGISHPSTAVKIGDLESKLSNFDRTRANMSYAEFVEKYMGSETVYVDKEGKGVAHYLIEAGQRALERAGMDSSEIDSVVIATMSQDDHIAGVRGEVLEGLNMYEKHVSEVLSACTGFMDALGVAADRAMVHNENVLVLGGDVFKSRFVDPQEYATVGLFGDGSAAAVLAPTEPGFGIKEGRTVTRPAWRPDAIQDPETKYFRMNAKALGIRIPAAFSQEFIRGVRRNGFDPRETVAIPHQVNGRLLRKLADKLHEEYSTPRENVVNVFHKIGNTVNASIGFALHHAFRDGLLKRGTNAVMFGAGAGFNFGYLGFTADRELPEQLPYRVLFVDDERDVVHGMVGTMEQRARNDPEFRKLFRFEPAIAYSGEEGLRYLVENPDVNLLVTDQRMGDMSGAQLAQVLKDRKRDIGYVMVTGFYDDAQEKPLIEKAGFAHVLRKPLDQEELWSVVRKGAWILRNRDSYKNL